MQKKIITTREEFAKLKIAWKEMLAALPNHTIFMTWEWQYHWWETYASRFMDAQLRIATYYDNGHLVAILPYFIYTEPVGPVQLRWASYLASKIESSDYLDVITLPGYRDYFLANLEHDLRELASGTDVIELNNCLPESIFFQTMGHSYSECAFTETYRVCPFVTLPDSFDGYLKKLSANFRSNVRRRLKKLLHREGVCFELLSDKGAIDDAIQNIFELHYWRAQQKRLDTKFVRELRLEFHQKVTRVLIPEGYIKLFYLATTDGQKIAGLYCFEYNDTLAYFQAGFNPAWANFSPGIVILAKAIEYAIKQGFREFDFMRGGEAYKRNWGVLERYIFLITVSNSPRGLAYLRYYRWRKRVAQVGRRWLRKVNKG